MTSIPSSSPYEITLTPSDIVHKTSNHPTATPTHASERNVLLPQEGKESKISEEDDDKNTSSTILITEDFFCPQSKIGTIIGTRGSVMQEIMSRTNCKIMIKQESIQNSSQERIIHVTGLFENVQAAKQLIQAVMTDGPLILQINAPGQDLSQPTMTEHMECPCDKVSLVIGSKGVVIQDIMKRSCCKILVEQDFPPGEPRVIVIQGRQSQIEIAKLLLSLVIEQGPNALHQPGVIGSTLHVTEEFDCPQDRVGIVIGSKGSIVQEIMKRTGCRIMVNQELPDGEPRKVVITGTPQQVKAGRSLVNAVIINGPIAVQGPPGSTGSIVQELKLLQSQVGKLIGPGGSIIKQVQQRFSVRLNIDQPTPHVEERKLRITGEPANVEAVMQYIWQLVNSSDSPPVQYPYSPVPQYSPAVNAIHVSTSPPSYEPSPPPLPTQIFAIPHQLPPPPPPQALGQGLGLDGSLGRLMPATPLGNGLVHQVVYLLKHLLGKIVGEKSTILQLIITKSGANVQIEQSPVIATGGQELSRLNVIGMAAGVTLAGQMIQEVLISGPEKIYRLPDANLGYEAQKQLPPSPTHQMSVHSPGVSPYQMRSSHQQYMTSYEAPGTPVYQGIYSSSPYVTYTQSASVDRNYGGQNFRREIQHPPLSNPVPPPQHINSPNYGRTVSAASGMPYAYPPPSTHHHAHPHPHQSATLYMSPIAHPMHQAHSPHSSHLMSSL